MELKTGGIHKKHAEQPCGSFREHKSIQFRNASAYPVIVLTVA
jgi:hypothetical protein